MTEATQSIKNAPGESLLGTTAKSSLRHGSEEGQRKAHRALKYQALSQGRQWLVRQAKAENPDAMPGDVYRTADCRYVNHSAIGVNISPVHKAAHYSGLVTCGSIWPCPVCASRIQERRRPEVQRPQREGQQPAHIPVMLQPPMKQTHENPWTSQREPGAYGRGSGP